MNLIIELIKYANAALLVLLALAPKESYNLKGMIFIRDCYHWHLSFPIFIALDLPAAIAKKFVYADDEAIMHSTKNRKALEEALVQNMATLSTYFTKFKPKFPCSQNSVCFYSP